MVKLKKEYIKDNNKIRKCTANISKMNIFEWIYYDFRYWNELKNMKYYFCENIGYLFLSIENLFLSIANLFLSIVELLTIILFPITILISATISIYRAKKEVKQYEGLKNVV